MADSSEGHKQVTRLGETVVQIPESISPEELEAALKKAERATRETLEKFTNGRSKMTDQNPKPTDPAEDLEAQQLGRLYRFIHQRAEFLRKREREQKAAEAAKENPLTDVDKKGG